jgi:DNA-binding beta-propeller fold protein YncE
MLRASDGSTLGTYSVGSGPFGICFDGVNIWVTNTWSNDVTKLSASDGSTLGTYNVGSNPMGICFDGANIWVANSRYNNVTKL